MTEIKLIIALVLLVIVLKLVLPEMVCTETKPFSAGNRTLGASGTYCAKWSNKNDK